MQALICTFIFLSYSIHMLKLSIYYITWLFNDTQRNVNSVQIYSKAFRVKWLHGFKARLVRQALEIYSWLRVLVSLKHCACTSRCRSGFGGISVVFVQLLLCCRSFFCYDMKAVLTHLSGQADKRFKGRKYVQDIHMHMVKQVNILNNMQCIWLTFVVVVRSRYIFCFTTGWILSNGTVNV